MLNLTKYPQPSVTIDIVWFTIFDGHLSLALTPRKHEPFKDSLSLPGSFVHIDETLDATVQRTITEHVSVDQLFTEQLYTIGNLDRDPRGRVISVSYFAISNQIPSSDLRWIDIAQLPDLAFDHNQIIHLAHKRLQDKLQYSDIAKHFLPAEFTLSQLQHVYEVILSTPQDKRNFRKKLLATDLLLPLSKTQMSGSHRPAQLFRFKNSHTTYF